MKRKTANRIDNVSLCALDMSQAPREEQIAWLMTILEQELDRGEGADTSLIAECIEQLAQLSPEYTPSAEETEAHLQALLATVSPPAASRETPLSPALQKPHISRGARRLLLRWATVAAVMIAVIALGPQVYAQAMIDRDNGYYEQALKDDVPLDPDRPPLSVAQLIAEEEVFDPTLPHTAVYDSTETLFAAESLDFAYPQALPEDYVLSHITVNYRSATDWTVIFRSTEPNAWTYTAEYLVEHPDYGNMASRYPKKFQSGDRIYYITKEENNTCTAMCIDGAIRYYVTARNPDRIEVLIEQIAAKPYTATYRTLEEFQHNLDLPRFEVPKDLPADREIVAITVSYVNAEQWTVNFHYKDPEIRGYTVSTSAIQPVFDPSERVYPYRYAMEKTQKYELYLRDGIYYACCVDEKNLSHMLRTDSLDLLWLMLTHTLSDPRTTKYDSLEDFLAGEPLLPSFIYPTNLPEEQEIQSVTLHYYHRTHWKVVFRFKDHAFNEYSVTHLPSEPSEIGLNASPLNIVIGDRVFRISSSSIQNEEYNYYHTDGNFLYHIRIFGKELSGEMIHRIFDPVS